MRLSRTKKYLYYLLVFMPFLVALANVLYFSFTKQILEQPPQDITYDILLSFHSICEGFIPNFVYFGNILEELFSNVDIWGDCLFVYFGYFVAITIYFILLDIMLFFIYIFESWVNKFEKKI